MRLSIQDQLALASRSVVTILLLQHTHNRAAQLVMPASDYANIYEPIELASPAGSFPWPMFADNLADQRPHLASRRPAPSPG
jgi:hypothetical protein